MKKFNGTDQMNYLKGLGYEKAQFEVIQAHDEFKKDVTIEAGMAKENIETWKTLGTFNTLPEAQESLKQYKTSIDDMGQYNLVNEYFIVLMPYNEDDEACMEDMFEYDITTVESEC